MARQARLAEMYDTQVTTHEAGRVGYLHAWEIMVTRILESGGDLVVPPMEYEALVEELTYRGSCWDRSGALMTRGCSAGANPMWRSCIAKAG